MISAVLISAVLYIIFLIILFSVNSASKEKERFIDDRQQLEFIKQYNSRRKK